MTGYTHEYLGPENLASTPAFVQDGILAPDGPAYKAIVLYGQTKITPSASAALLEFAEAGLPIFVLDSAPNITIGAKGQQQVSENILRLTKGDFPSVKMMPAADFGPAALSEAGILPRVSISDTDGVKNASQLFSTWRSNPDQGLELVYLLNRGPAATFYLSITTLPNAAPYILDAWTGEQSPLVAYTRSESGISTVVSLEERETTIFAFAESGNEESGVPLYVVSHSANIARLLPDGKGRIEAFIDDSGEANALLSNNAVVDIPPSNASDRPLALPTATLGPWSLTVESYTAPEILHTSSNVSSNITTIPAPLPLETLVPWTKIQGLERSSGIGTYRTSFGSLPQPADANMSYTLHFTGPVTNTIRVMVNSVTLPAVDISAPGNGLDITGVLREDSDNEVVVEVTSTLFNAVKGRMGELKSAGRGVQVPRYYTDVQWAEFGLVGEVVVRAWRRVQLS